MSSTLQPPPSAPPAQAPQLGSARELVTGRTIGLILATAILFAVMTVMSRTFLSVSTMTLFMTWISYFVLIALAQAVCLVVGGMNLSVGAIGSMSIVILGLCLDPQFLGISPWLGVPAALAVGAVAGLLNGLIITRLKIDSFIVTLSVMFILMGLRSGISRGFPYKVPASFTFIGQETTPPLWLPYIGSFSLHIPYMFLVMLAVLALMGYMFRNTVFGRRLIATGGNAEAARLSGISTNSMIVWANILSGLLAALAGILWVSKEGAVTPSNGDDWLLISFAVAIIGGTGLNGGVISVVGIFMGALIYRFITFGLVSLDINPFFSQCYIGLLILLTIVLDRVREIYSDCAKTAAQRH